MHDGNAIAGSVSPLEDSKLARREVLRAEELRKFYGSREALKGLSFSLRAGSVLGFLGPNGAGKTTAIRILTTILEPSSGRFTVDGISSEHPEEIRRRIGVLPESLGFPRSNTALEYLTYFGRLHGHPASRARAVAASLLEEVGLQQRAKTLIGSFSRGMRQRLGIARALVNDPVVLFLDEPTLGLDPRGQKELLALVGGIAHERQASIVLCSHLLWEVEEICDNVLIMRSGQVAARGSVGDVIRQGRAGSVQDEIRVHVPADAVAKARHALETVPEVRSVTPIAGTEGWLTVELADPGNGGDPDPKHNNALLGALLSAEIPVLAFRAETGRLQDAFLQLTQEAAT